jgi:hypothetical protein
MAPTVVFILATSHAGSHLLAQLLGAHSRCLSIGELRSFHALRGPRSSRRGRHLVSDYANNPLFAGLAGLPEAAWHNRIFNNLQHYQPQVRVLVDNSKRPSWARRRGDSTAQTVRLLHLIRDPRALVRRWQAVYDTVDARRAQRLRLARRRPEWALRAAFAPLDVVLALKWLRANQDISAAMAADGATALVSYDDLVTDPGATLQGLMPQLGLDFEPGQLAYGRAPHAGTLKRDYIGAAGRSEILPDRKWRTELPAEVVTRISALAPILRYLHRLGLHLDAEGLWAVPRPFAQRAAWHSSGAQPASDCRGNARQSA